MSRSKNVEVLPVTSNLVEVIAKELIHVRSKDEFVTAGNSFFTTPEAAKKLFSLGMVEFPNQPVEQPTDQQVDQSESNKEQ